MAVRAIPAGTQTVVPHLSVAEAAKAIEFYKKVFGAEERSRALSPDGKIMHAALQIADCVVYVSDAFGPPVTPSGISIHLWSDDPDGLFARAVKAGATVKHPLAAMFWGDRYGQLVDPFGQTWAIAKHLEDLTPQELERRGAEFFKKMSATGCG